MKLTFLGATGTVTGSKYLVEADKKKILVDCGLFQGFKELRLRNWDRLSVNPQELDAVILTHAHIDHSGYLPLLIKNGFKGVVYCSSATFDLCSILLPDSGHIHEEDAKRANKYGYTKHKPALPLYTREDAEKSLEFFQVVGFDENHKLTDNLMFHFDYAGHILGSAFVTLKHNDKKLVFSGDIGRSNDLVMRPPTILKSADYLVLESTYGNRLHNKTDPTDQICEIVNSAVQRGGTILIPAFAVGRAQQLLYYIYQLKKDHRIPDLPVYLDSPLAINATKIFYKHAGEHRLSKQLCQEVCSGAVYTNTQEQSKSIDVNKGSKIIISASGMATGGRVLHHLKVFAPDPRNAILFTGFQAEGTRGDKMVRGIAEVKIHGEIFPVNAEVDSLNNMSAHADYEEILQWLSNFKTAPKKTFITHGNLEASLSLQKKIEEKFGWKCYVPKFLQTEVL